MSESNFKRVCTVPREGPPIYQDGSVDYWEWERRFNEDRNRRKAREGTA